MVGWKRGWDGKGMCEAGTWTLVRENAFDFWILGVVRVFDFAILLLPFAPARSCVVRTCVRFVRSYLLAYTAVPMPFAEGTGLTVGVDLSLSPTEILSALLDGIFDSSPPRYTVGKLCVSAFLPTVCFGCCVS